MAATRSRDVLKAATKASSEEPGLGDLFFVDNKGSKVSKGKKGKKGARGDSDIVKKASGKAAHVSTESSHEAEWERILFGVNAGADNDDNDDEEEADHASLSGPESAVADADDDSGITSDNEPAHAQKGRQRTTRKGAAEKQDKKPVWHDDDDENLCIDLAGKDRLRKLRKSEEETLISGPEFAKRVREQASTMSQSVNWATRKKFRNEDQEGDSILRSAAALTGERSPLLPSSALEVERLKDANWQDTSDAVIQSTRFHPNSQLLFTASLDKRLKFFQIDGKSNSKVQGVHFEDLPIQCAEYSADGAEVLVSGRRKFFYVYNLAHAAISKVQGVLGSSDKFLGAMLPSPDSQYIASLGTCGQIALLSGKSKQWIGELKMNCDVSAAVFSGDGYSMYTAGKSALVYHWDLRMRRCIKKLVDDGSLHITSLALSSGNVMAVGSQIGVVNTYDMHACSALPLDSFGHCRPATRKAVMNLTTGIRTLNFNGDGQMLLMASQAKKEALRILHTATSSVYPNWPTAGTPLHSVSCTAFSPNNRLLAIGNDRGKVLLYRLKHYA